jgi:hypothetical protein
MRPCVAIPLRLAILVGALAALQAVSVTASADDTREQARQAYDQGTQARRRGDFAEAAADFARADSLAPSAAALTAALEDCVRADDPVLGMEIIDRSNRGAADAALSASVTAARDKFKGRAGRIAIHCPESHTCLATLDGKAVDASRGIWALATQHTLIVQVDDLAQPRLVDVKPDAVVDVTPALPSEAAPVPVPVPGPTPTPTPTPTPAPAPAPAPTPAPAKPLSPVWFWIGAGATVLLGGGTAFSAVDTANHHGDFSTDGCAQAGSPTCDGLATNGSAAQQRTNALVIATAAVGVATVIVGLFFTRWSSDTGAATHVGVVPRAGGLGFQF